MLASVTTVLFKDGDALFRAVSVSVSAFMVSGRSKAGQSKPCLVLTTKYFTYLELLVLPFLCSLVGKIGIATRPL